MYSGYNKLKDKEKTAKDNKMMLKFYGCPEGMSPDAFEELRLKVHDAALNAAIHSND